MLINEQPKFANKKQVLKIYFPASEATLYRAIRKGIFPAPVEISPNRRVWLVEELDNWLAQHQIKYSLNTHKKAH